MQTLCRRRIPAFRKFRPDTTMLKGVISAEGVLRRARFGSNHFPRALKADRCKRFEPSTRPARSGQTIFTQRLSPPAWRQITHDVSPGRSDTASCPRVAFQAIGDAYGHAPLPSGPAAGWRAGHRDDLGLVGSVEETADRYGRGRRDCTPAANPDDLRHQSGGPAALVRPGSLWTQNQRHPELGPHPDQDLGWGQLGWQDGGAIHV